MFASLCIHWYVLYFLTFIFSPHAGVISIPLFIPHKLFNWKFENNICVFWCLCIQISVGSLYLQVELLIHSVSMGFPGSSIVKNLLANARDIHSIPGSEWYPGDGNGIQSSILAWESHGQRSLVGYSPGGCKRVGHDLVTKQQEYTSIYFSWSWKVIFPRHLY